MCAQVAVWLDSDTLVARSLHTLFDLASSLPGPGSAEPGPRIGGTFARGHYRRLLHGGNTTVTKINTGVFIVKPGNMIIFYDNNILKLIPDLNK